MPAEHHSHSHHAGHSHAPANFNKAFIVGILLNLTFVFVEFGYGYISHSLALVADASHNLSDVFGLSIAWIATLLVKRKPTGRFTYGLQSSSILAALLNAVVLLIAVGAIILEAVQRFNNPQVIAGNTVMIVAAIGIFINSATAFLFMSGRKSDLNLRGAFLHMAMDALVSVGVVVAGFVILKTGWLWIDPLLSILISIVIIVSTWNLFTESLGLALNAVPTNIDSKEVLSFLKKQTGVKDVHDLHIWAMSTTDTALTAHLIIPQGHPGDEFLQATSAALKNKFKINHTTLQIEIADTTAHCALEPDDVI